MARSRGDFERIIDQGLGRTRADLVIKNARWLNVVTAEIATGDIAICGDRIVGTYESYSGAREIDARGLIAVPGFIDYRRVVPPQSSGRERATKHMALNLTTVGLFIAAALLRRDDAAGPDNIVLALEAIATGTLGAAGWLGEVNE